ncbi:hypothetical protein H4582DRAFT_1822514, partial [Lactarius indigo]
DANAKDRAGSTPLHLASFRGRVQAARLLLDGWVIPDAEDKKGGTPLCAASSMGETDIACFLLNGRTNADSKDKSGSTPVVNGMYSSSFFSIHISGRAIAEKFCPREREYAPSQENWKGTFLSRFHGYSIR